MMWIWLHVLMWESELVVEKGNKQLELLTIALASSSSLGNYFYHMVENHTEGTVTWYATCSTRICFLSCHNSSMVLEIHSQVNLSSSSGSIKCTTSSLPAFRLYGMPSLTLNILVKFLLTTQTCTQLVQINNVSRRQSSGDGFFMEQFKL
jgi:hypothetical protein